MADASAVLNVVPETRRFVRCAIMHRCVAPNVVAPKVERIDEDERSVCSAHNGCGK